MHSRDTTVLIDYRLKSKVPKLCYNMLYSNMNQQLFDLYNQSNHYEN